MANNKALKCIQFSLDRKSKQKQPKQLCSSFLLSLHSNHITKRLYSIHSFRQSQDHLIFQATRRIKSLFPCKDRLNLSHSLLGRDVNEVYIGKTELRFHDRKTEHFSSLAKSDYSSAIAGPCENQWMMMMKPLFKCHKRDSSTW